MTTITYKYSHSPHVYRGVHAIPECGSDANEETVLLGYWAITPSAGSISLSRNRSEFVPAHLIISINEGK